MASSEPCAANLFGAICGGNLFLAERPVEAAALLGNLLGGA
jgi:hypothetical protein